MLAGTGSTTKEVAVSFTPQMVSLEGEAPAQFRVIISDLPEPYEPSDIRGSTVKVEEALAMKLMPNWPQVTKKFFAFKIDGSELVNTMILPKIAHMNPQPGTKVEVALTVTGEFNDGVGFTGTFNMLVLTEHSWKVFGDTPRLVRTTETSSHSFQSLPSLEA